MPLLVVGSVAYDSIQTPTAVRERVLGGSAMYFSYCSQLFHPRPLSGRGRRGLGGGAYRTAAKTRASTRWAASRERGKTFYWKGKYLPNMNDRETLEVQLNVFGDFNPVLPRNFRRSRICVPGQRLAHVAAKGAGPDAQSPKLVVADTMDLWIRRSARRADELLKRVDGLVMNDSEAKLLTGDENLVHAGHHVLELGPKFVVIKKGEHGAMFFSEHETYVLPAYPDRSRRRSHRRRRQLRRRHDGLSRFDRTTSIRARSREAMAYGILVASFNVEDFSLDRMKADRTRRSRAANGAVQADAQFRLSGAR